MVNACNRCGLDTLESTICEVCRHERVYRRGHKRLRMHGRTRFYH